MAKSTELNLTGLTEYVNENRDQLFVNATVGAKTLDYVEIMPNVKYKDALHYLDSEVALQKAACGWDPQGSDTIAERFIEVAAVEVEKEWCYLDFQKYFMNYQLQFEAGRETLPFEEKFAQSNVEKIKEAVETLVWDGNEDLGIDGFINQITDEGEQVEFALGSTVSEKVNALVAALTAKMLKKGVNIFMSMTDFRNYVLENNSVCCGNRPMIDAASEKITYAGDSRITLIPVLGLENSGDMVAATPDALVYGTDIEGSETVYRLWFDEKEQKFLFRVLFNAGTAVKFVDEVILGVDGR